MPWFHAPLKIVRALLNALKWTFRRLVTVLVERQPVTDALMDLNTECLVKDGSIRIFVQGKMGQRMELYRLTEVDRIAHDKPCFVAEGEAGRLFILSIVGYAPFEGGYEAETTALVRCLRRIGVSPFWIHSGPLFIERLHDRYILRTSGHFAFELTAKHSGQPLVVPIDLEDWSVEDFTQSELDDKKTKFVLDALITYANDSRS